MNILDYTYDLNVIEDKLYNGSLKPDLARFVSFLNNDFTKEELVEEVIVLLKSFPETFTQKDLDEAYEQGFSNAKWEYGIED